MDRHHIMVVPVQSGKTEALREARLLQEIRLPSSPSRSDVARLEQSIADAIQIIRAQAEAITSTSLPMWDAITKMRKAFIAPYPPHRGKKVFRPSRHLSKTGPFRLGPAYHRRTMSRRKR